MIDEMPLSAILNLARSGSFKTTARALGVSNATVSRIVQRAENDLGMTLFQRRRSGCSLTPEGRAFLPVAERLHRDLNRFRKASGALTRNVGDTLSVGCGPLTTRTLLVPALLDILKLRPDLRSRISVSATGEPISGLERGEIDLFLGDLTYTPLSEDIEIHVLRKRSVVFVARHGHPLHQGGPHRIGTVFRKHGFASPFLHKHWRTALTGVLGGDDEAAAVVNQLPQVQCDDYGLLAAMCRNSDIVAGGMAENFAEFIALGQLVPIPIVDVLTWNICVARKIGAHGAARDLLWDRLVAGDGAGATIP